MNSHDPMATQARAIFEHSVANLDVATANRLRLMRRDTLSQSAPNRFKSYLIPISTGLAVALGVAIFLPQFQTGKTITEQDTLYISAEDDAEAELLTWLADAPVEIPSHIKGSL